MVAIGSVCAGFGRRAVAPLSAVVTSALVPSIESATVGFMQHIPVASESIRMQTVTVTRTIPASTDAVRDAMLNLEPFTRAAGFDDVTVDGGAIHVANRVGIAEIELELAVVEDPDATLVIEQRDGIFEEMRTVYDATESPDGAEVTASTDFALDVAVVGGLLDATVIKRQRRRELTGQLDYLETAAD